jgi:hypothetical protein
MKIYFTLALFTVLFLSCKEEVNSPANEVQLESIVSEFLGRDASILFEYDTLDRLARVEDHFERERIEYAYTINTLEKIFTYDSLGQLISLDSVTYHQNGQIEKLYRYFTDDNGHLKEIIIYEYVYNTDGRIERLISINPSSGATMAYKTYAWLNGNISHINEYSGNDHLFIEYSFEYDHQLNYRWHNPYYYFDPQYTTDNNVVKATLKDHTGLYNGICNPCLLSYLYNTSGYPTWFKYEGGTEKFINYR